MRNSHPSPGLPRPDAAQQAAPGGHADKLGAFRQRWSGGQGCLRAMACAVSASLLLLSGCAPLDARKDAKYLDKIYEADRPVYGRCAPYRAFPTR
jgi:hypothetical protein